VNYGRFSIERAMVIPFGKKGKALRSESLKRIGYKIESVTSIRTYKVITGIFEGTLFKGHETVINNEVRIWNDESRGQSFPASHCLTQF